MATLHRGEARFQKGDQVAENNATIDLVLAEIVMPEITGIELVKVIHARQPALPIILMTGYGDHDVLKGRGKRRYPKVL